MKAEQVLDAAARLYAERGVTAVGMGEIARAAGCSRATLYRYFPDRHQLHVAFVQREARRIGALLPTGDPVESILAALAQVRARPELLAWFGAADAGTTAELAQSDAVIGMLRHEGADEETARWLVRVIVSLLIVPGRDDAEERAIVERYVVPGVLGSRR